MNEAAWRASIFLGVLAALALLELAIGGPNPPPRRARRWPANAGLVLLDTALARVLLPAGAVGAALWAEAGGVGLFNRFEPAPWLEWLLALVILDLAIYWQHRLLHAVPWLWPLHRVHHTDATLDATSALRFHPLEILFSLAFKVAIVVVLGIAPAIVLVFEILLSSFALVTHANLALPARLDRVVRWVLVTPTMHRVHHSVRIVEQRSNFGFNLSCWDRLFRSYRVESQDSPQAFGVIGVDVERATRFDRLLREPFVRRR